MPEFSKKLSHSIEYLSLRFIERSLSIMPRFLALRLGFAAGFVFYLSGLFRKTAVANMKHAGFWSDKQIDSIIKKLYLNIGMYMVDFLRTTSRPPACRIHNYEFVDDLSSRKKGIIVLLAHLGNWELLADIFGKKIPDLNVIAKRMKNRRVDQWLARKRSLTGVVTIYSEQALRKMIEVLKRNGMVAILIDQHAGKHGTMVPFLGKPANTVRTVAGLVQKSGYPVLPVHAIMSKDGSYDILIERPSEPDLKNKDNEECIGEYQKLHNEIISAWIRRYPEHYFGWFHKRFRNLIRY